MMAVKSRKKTGVTAADGVGGIKEKKEYNNSNNSQKLADLVGRMTETDPEQRPTVKDVMEKLQPLLAG